jgi:thiamine-monophosphate kinase
MTEEFAFIGKLVEKFGRTGKGLPVGIGDDCAHLTPSVGFTQLVTIDTLTDGVHFASQSASWIDIGYKAVAVNLSDLAASGVSIDEPILLFIAASIPTNMASDAIEAFVDGIAECVEKHGAKVAGGDTTSTPGPFSVTITALGYSISPIARSGACPGDLLGIFGGVGKAGAAFEARKQGLDASATDLAAALDRPTPLLKIGSALSRAEAVHAMIDISDGLVADATHLCEESKCGVEIDLNCVPLSKTAVGLLGEEKALELATTFGDDYALLFAAGPDERESIDALSEELKMPVSWIGTFIDSPSKVRLTRNGTPVEKFEQSGFQHKVGRK